MKDLLFQVQRGQELSVADVEHAVKALMSPEVSTIEKADFLVALHERGETPAEIAAFVEALLAYSLAPHLEGRDTSRPLLDVCGTGGDRVGLFNVSTSVMFVAAACGADVVKHGNRSITSKSGGADVLEALGIPIDLPPEKAGAFLQRCGFVFLFAPKYHPAFREIAPVRQQLAAEGKTTVFNILGPLLNPAKPDYQLAGVFQESFLPIYGEVFRLLGRKSAWAVHGKTASGEGLDELSILGVSRITRLENRILDEMTVEPSSLEMEGGELEALRGGGPQENAEILENLLRGEDQGARRRMLLLNTAGALCACNLAENLSQGLAQAAFAIDSGQAYEGLKKGQGCIV